MKWKEDVQKGPIGIISGLIETLIWEGTIGSPSRFFAIEEWNIISILFYVFHPNQIFLIN